jgi:hypothetical protein
LFRGTTITTLEEERMDEISCVNTIDAESPPPRVVGKKNQPTDEGHNMQFENPFSEDIIEKKNTIVGVLTSKKTKKTTASKR